MTDRTRRLLEVGSASEWRSWLKKNHHSVNEVWLIFHRKGSGTASISYEEALDEALAFGWIDSLIRRLDDTSYARKFTPRKPWSIWSKPNISRIKRLNKEGRMTKWGLLAFEKRTGEISLLEKFNREGVKTPKDLEDALMKNPTAWENYRRFAPSHRKRYLIWISGAKRNETRQKRIDEAVVLISRNVKSLLR